MVSELYVSHGLGQVIFKFFEKDNVKNFACCVVSDTTIGLGLSVFLPMRWATSSLISPAGLSFENKRVCGIFVTEIEKVFTSSGTFSS